MKKFSFLLCLLLFLAANAASATLKERCDALTRPELQAVVQFLADDLVEGRAPGTRGGELAEIYIQSLFKLLGLQPGWQGSYFQPFELRGFTTRDVRLNAGGIELGQPDDLMGSYTGEEKDFTVSGRAVFCGFGIRSDIWKWDDFKKADLRGKVLIVRANDPGLWRSDIFEGRTLTYFGRWTYKMEEAARQGAAAVLIVHTDETAGYGWTVVQNSWSGEESYLPAELQDSLRFRGWIREESLKQILAKRNVKLEKLYQKSLQPGFKPVDLGFDVSFRGRSQFRSLTTRNVVATIPGRKPQQIVLSAHIDHFGRNPELAGDPIFNGAIDNAVPVAALIQTARILNECKKDLEYSLVFLACQAEEGGLLGSRYFAENADPATLAAAINFESTPPWEASPEIFGVGARFSTLEESLKAVAAAQGWRYSEFSMADQGFYFRSDQFPFAQIGVPAVWVSAGERSLAGENKLEKFFRGGAYHTVKDEYDPTWELEGLRQTIKLAVLLVDRLNREKDPPRWKGRLPFPISGK